MDVGTPVSHYRLLRPLGEGGMGQVYLAEDALLGRNVALKFVRSDDLADPAASRRLLHEAKAAASLDHPFICKIFEVGESDEGPFIAMEYLDGRTLEECLSSGPVRAGDALRVGGEIAEALAAAHSHGIVHRDLKPSNVMITADGHVKVMDFGIAKRFAYEPAATTRSTLSSVDTITGTLLYMSPEQVLGQPVTPASDLFALGIVLYELLTGAHPFKRQTSLATAGAIAHEAAAAIPVSLTNAANIDAVIQRLLAKDPSERCASAAEVVTLLRQVSAEPPRQDTRWTSRAVGRAWVIGSSLVVLVVAGALAWLLLRPGPALAFQERDWVVVADLDNRTTEKSFDSAIDSAFTVALRQSRFVNVLPRSRVTEAVRLAGRQATARLDESLASDVAVREGARAVLAVSLASSGGGYTLDARLVDPRTRHVVMAGAVRAPNKQAILPALDTLAARIRHELGESLDSVSQQNTALPMATTSSLEALKLFVDGRQLATRDEQAGYGLIREAVRIDPDFAMAHADLAMYSSLHGDRATAEQHFERALKLIDRLTVRERLWIQALAEDARGNREEAVVAYRSYLARYPDDADGWYRLGWTQMATLNRPEDAIESFENVLRINPASAGAYSNLATCYQLLDKYDQSLKYYEKTFSLRPALMTSGFLNHQYGFTLVALGRTDEARRAFEKMAADPDRDKQASGLRSMAILEMYQGRYRQAIGHLESAVLLNQSYKNALGELRNRLFIAGAARTLGDHRRLFAELGEADRLIASRKLDPGIVSDAGSYYAREGRVRAAHRVLGFVVAGISDRTSVSTVNRSARHDEAVLDVLKGEIALAEGKWQDAIPLFEISLRLSPEGDGMEPLARAYAAAQRWDDAVRLYSTMSKMYSRGTEQQEWVQVARFELGNLYSRRGDRVKARAAYEQFLDRWKDADAEIPLLREARKRLAALQ